MRASRATTGSINSAILAVVFGCLAMLAPAVASAGWSAPVTVSGPGSSTSQTRIAGAEDGTSWVVWKRALGGFDVIQGTRVQIDGSQGPVQTLSDPARNATDPVIEARADGSAMVGWIDTSATDDAVVTVAIDADGTAGTPVTRSIPGPVGQPASDLAIALGSDGSAGLAWLKDDGSELVVQAMKIGSDGTGGTIHDLSDPASSAGQPAIAAVPPFGNTTTNTYRTVWPQGAGVDANVYSREIKADDTTDEIYKALWPRIPVAPGDPVGPGTGGDPQEVHIEYGSDNAMNVLWRRHRTDYVINGVNDTFSHDPNSPSYDPEDPLDTPYQNWAIEMIRANAGAVLNNSAPLAVNPITPVVEGTPYNVRGFDMDKGFGGQPVMSWIHDLNGGDAQVETGRIRGNGLYAEWLKGTVIPDAGSSVIAANSSESAVAGWTVPGAVPGQEEASWTRFSNSFWENYSPSGDFLYSFDPGFVVAGNGITLGAFTAVNGASVGTSRIAVFTDPDLTVSDALDFGRRNIGSSATQSINIRSAGETPVQVTDIAISGPSAAQYSLTGASNCVKTIGSGVSCQFKVVFTPGSTAVQNAKVTVTSEAGTSETTLTGSGLDRTRNQVTAKPKRKSVRRGKSVKIRVRAANLGGVASRSTRVCVRLNQRALKLAGNRCRSLGSLAAGANRNLNFRVRVTGRVKRGKRLPVTILMRSGNAVVRQAVVRIGRKR